MTCPCLPFHVQPKSHPILTPNLGQFLGGRSMKGLVEKQGLASGKISPLTFFKREIQDYPDIQPFELYLKAVSSSFATHHTVDSLGPVGYITSVRAKCQHDRLRTRGR